MTSKCEIDEDGTKRWRNSERQVHREDGPAVEYADGWYKAWYRNGLFHREDGPACEWADGRKNWYRNGLFHREDGPAIIHPSGPNEWFKDGAKIWLRNGKLHREDGPAVERLGANEWYINGAKLTEEEFLKRTKKEEPKMEVKCEIAEDGTRRWFVDGVEYSRQEFETTPIPIRANNVREEKASEDLVPISEPKQEGRKNDKDKLQWHLLMEMDSLQQVAIVMHGGAKKYAPKNYKKVPGWKWRYIDAAYRHMKKHLSGEKIDPDFGQYHIAHAIASLLMLLENEVHNEPNGD
jgi:hypothetical protein